MALHATTEHAGRVGVELSAMLTVELPTPYLYRRIGDLMRETGAYPR